jgi:hypothetical protein
MKRITSLVTFGLATSIVPMFGNSVADKVDLQLEKGVADLEVKTAPLIEDLAFLRKVTVDLLGRIPTYDEIKQFQEWPLSERRKLAVDSIVEDKRFNDRWMVFFADMLRIRSNKTGGPQMLAFVRKCIEERTPYDHMVRELVSTNGDPRKLPAAGFILGDDVDPMALAGATSQVFLGVRIACAQCHNHPFDDWEQEQFYGFAAYFGKTKLVEPRVGDRDLPPFTTEGHEQMVLWPPERNKPPKRWAVTPKFPFELASYDNKNVPSYIARLREKRKVEASSKEAASKLVSLDDFLDDIDASAKGPRKIGPGGFDFDGELMKEKSKIDLIGDKYKASQLRKEMATLLTQPENRYFARAFVNRIWKELMGRGFFEPIDNYSAYNDIAHEEVLEFLSDEFVASGYDLRELIKHITATKAYRRGHLYSDTSEKLRKRSEHNFTAAPVRRMISEALFDSIVIAGNLMNQQKWNSGENVRTWVELERRTVFLETEDEDGEEGTETESPVPAATPEPAMEPKMMVMAKAPAMQPSYDLEQGLELDFDALLSDTADVENELAKMKSMSDEKVKMEQEQMMEQERQNRRRKTTLVEVEKSADYNPSYGTSMRMASPAPPASFIRVFGQPARDRLGEFRDPSASMRQALMMINGKAVHDASRVGTKERLYRLLTDDEPKIDQAIEMAYLEILTRKPTEVEHLDALTILHTADNLLDGMADLRWILFNTHEFRFL